MSTKFFTNQDNNTLLQKLEGIFAHTNVHFFDALVGYFRSSGYFRIRPFLDKVTEIRILVGIDVDQYAQKYQAKGLELRFESDEIRKEALAKLEKDIQTADYDAETENGIKQFVGDIVDGKLKVKIHPSRNIHAKIYIFRQQTEHTHAGWGAVITGSSNLTEPGLEKNFEFNVELRDYDDVKYAAKTFEELWLQGIDLSPEHVSPLLKDTYLKDDVTPYELYIKFLIVHFGSSVDYDPNVVGDLPKKFLRLEYQIDAVNAGFEKLKKHNGYFLADVVGLGKTIVALLTARRFQFHNGGQTHVLVICPPALQDNWYETIRNFKLSNIDVVTSGSLHKINGAREYKLPEDYDMIIVDEAHKFRTDTTNSYADLQKLCKTPRATGGQNDPNDLVKKVILVSATPLNNRPEDIRNLVQLFQDGRVTTLESVPNLTHFFASLVEEFRSIKVDMAIAQTPQTRAPHIKRLQVLYQEIRMKVVAPLMVRRTRADLLGNEAYNKDLTAQGIKFPKVSVPNKILYQLSPLLEDLYDNTIMALSSALSYARYQAIGNLVEDKARFFPQGKRVSMSLAYIMKTMLVKRLDSSFYSFTKTLQRYQQANQNMLRMFADGIVFIAPELKVNEMIESGQQDQLLEKVEALELAEGIERKFRPKDFVPTFISKLEADQAILDKLVPQWQAIDEDPKLDMFIDKIKTEFFDRARNLDQKLVVFSEAADTTNYLAEKLKVALDGVHTILSVSSANRHAMQNEVKENFDANALKQRNAYDIILTTEVLAEGVNLHRSNVIINYDTPWNSTRLMQRIGRVNRIGTRAEEIHVYNFYPTARVDNTIQLYNKALIKLQAFHTALGEDSQIYSEEEEFTTFGLFDKPIEDSERDHRLSYLLALRKLKVNQPDVYRRIANLPDRIRCGRHKPTQNGSTFVYLRNTKREDFLVVKADGTVKEISFLDAADLLQCPEDLSPMALPPNHHTQVKQGTAYFGRVVVQAAVEATALVTRTKGPQENKALLLLKEVRRIQIDLLTDAEKTLIAAGLEAVERGRFQKLTRDLARLYKKQIDKKNPEGRLSQDDLLKDILFQLNDFPLISLDQDNIPILMPTSAPDIILSESFC